MIKRKQPREFKTGERVLQSGIYEARDVSGNCDPATVVLTSMESFPPCACNRTASFRLLRAAPHISDDPDFR